MDIDVYIHQLLTASPAPTTLGINIFPDLAAANQQGQYCVYQVISKTPILTQEGDPESLRVWRYQFKQFGPSYWATRRDTDSLRNFLVNYRDYGVPGIQRVLEISQMGLPATGTGRLFCRMVELQISENLV